MNENPWNHPVAVPHDAAQGCQSLSANLAKSMKFSGKITGLA